MTKNTDGETSDQKHRWQKLNEFFDRARNLQTQEERQAFLTGACAGDDNLKREIEELLVATEIAENNDFLAGNGFVADLQLL